MLYITLILAVSCYLTVEVLQIGRRRRCWPPEPPTLPVVGNLHLLSPTVTHLQFTKWTKIYGEIFSLTLGPGVMVVLSSSHAVREILDKQSAITGSRPPSHFDDILHEGKYLAICPSSNEWRLLRKAANSLLTPQSAQRQIPIQRAESLQLMHDVLKVPERTWWHLRRTANSSIFSVLWGKRAPKDRVSGGRYTDLDCFMDNVIRRQEELELTDEMAALLGTVLLEGASDTTPTLLQSFLLLVTAHPEVQRKLHDEMDSVVGVGRVPNPNDFQNLPYLQATMRETHRFRPVFPIGIPHYTLEDVIYGKYTIPKGSVLAVNLWGIYHDPEVFEDPHTFNPDRYMQSEFGVKPAINDTLFRHSLPCGVGRRICPGRHVAEQATRIQAADLIWGFEFTANEPLDLNAYEPGIVMASKPFKVCIKPRSMHHGEIIESGFADAIPLFAPYEERLSAEEKEWFTEWARKYGDIFSLTLGPGVMVVLSSAHAVREILERQSAVTSSRPPSHFDDILHEGKYLAICQASNNWRLLRKAANSLLTPQSAVKHIPLQRAESLQLMYDVMKAPERTWWHLRRAATSAVFSVLWGKRAPKIDSQDVAMVFEIAEAETQVYTPGKHAPVDLLPILKYVPERWAPWKGICRDLRELQMSFYTRLTNECKERMYSSQQVDTLCFMDAVVKRQQELELTDDMAALLGAVLLEGGSDTTATFMQSFLLMVTAHPEVQRKLHEEMDRVVGDGRTPNMDDFHN
ncbi:cytochrome P450, partial [Punctularia strigosozonata HHB-11173 SS5]|uniref:cytochrome P450 n=1 Tax=Punctularia strigosozonata (strain HHB-11173) TaxID=741275 RepID=UPI0004416C07